MDALIVVLFVSAMLGAAAFTTWLKRRGKRYERKRYGTPPDLRRADDAETEPYDAKTARERAFRVFDETTGQV